MSDPMACPGALALNDAGVRVGAAVLLDGVTACCHPGRMTALLGPNGAGKTTLLHLLAGLTRPSRGQVVLGGQPLARWPTAQLARTRAMMAQHSALAFDFRVEEVVALGRHPHRRQPSRQEAHIVPAALALADVAHLVGRRFGSLSGGEQARVQLARVMAQLWEPVTDAAGQPLTRWLLLDEPIAALDWSHQMRLMDTVRRWSHAQHAGVIAIVHDLNIALRYADDALRLAHGEAASHGPVAEVLTAERIGRVWGIGCTPVHTDQGLLQYLFSY